MPMLSRAHPQLSLHRIVKFPDRQARHKIPSSQNAIIAVNAIIACIAFIEFTPDAG
jgi:hypothetical protein